MIILYLFLVATFSSPKAIAAPQDSAIFLGMLEHSLGDYVDQPSYHSIRALFKNEHSEWIPFKSECKDHACLSDAVNEYPRQASWFISYQGKKLGELTGNVQKEFKFYSHIGRQDVAKNSTIPHVGKPSPLFGGFGSKTVYRPLIATSKPFYKNPDQWRKKQLDVQCAKLLRKEFRKTFPIVNNCRNNSENQAAPWTYSDSDVKVINSFGSKGKWILAQLQLNEYRCDGPREDSFQNHWFVISPEEKVSYLSQGLAFIDAGDYDGKGNSQLVFMINRYNQGGYEIYYDNFRKHAVFQFGYH